MPAILDRGERRARDATRRGLPDLPIELRVLSAPDHEGPGADAVQVRRHGRIGTAEGVARRDEGGATDTRRPLLHDRLHPGLVDIPGIVEHGPFQKTSHVLRARMPHVGRQDEGRVESDRLPWHGRSQPGRVEDDKAVHLVRSIEGQHDSESSSERAPDDDRFLEMHGIKERADGPSIGRDAAVLPGEGPALVVTGKVRGDPGAPPTELAGKGEPDLGPRRVSVEEEDRGLASPTRIASRGREIAESDAAPFDWSWATSATRRSSSSGYRRVIVADRRPLRIGSETSCWTNSRTAARTKSERPAKPRSFARVSICCTRGSGRETDMIDMVSAQRLM